MNSFKKMLSLYYVIFGRTVYTKNVVCLFVCQQNTLNITMSLHFLGTEPGEMGTDMRKEDKEKPLPAEETGTQEEDSTPTDSAGTVKNVWEYF